MNPLWYFIAGCLFGAIPLLIAHERALRDSEATKQLAYRTLELTQRVCGGCAGGGQGDAAGGSG